ncbi:MAG TPA: TolC family protein [Oligoflexia bacterium]|nr:TolC family protein [Oligoflexia bacterium]HMR23814.1 TolC family protein [Oligoflexia bacterium]
MIQVKNNAYVISKLRACKLLLLIVLIYRCEYSNALTWEEAKASLAKNNYNLNVNYENIHVAKNDMIQTRSRLYPEISLRGGAERFLQEDASLGFRSFLGPRLTWSLYQGGRVKHSVRQARINIKKQINTYSLSEVEQQAQLRQIFASAVYAKKNIALAETSLERAKNNNRYVRLNYKGGQEYVWVFQSSQKTVLESEANLLKAEQEAKKALFTLQQMIGEDIVTSLDEIQEAQFNVPENIDEEINVNSYIEKHPELEIAKQNETIANLNHKVAKANMLPSLIFRTDFIVADTDESQVFPFWYAGVNLTVPLFESGRNKKASENARIKFKQSQQLYQQVKLKQKQDIEQQVLNYKWALKNRSVSILNLESLQNKYKLFEKQYREGLIPYTLWDSTQIELRTAENKWLQSLQLLQVEYAKLLLVLGVTEDEFKSN